MYTGSVGETHASVCDLVAWRLRAASHGLRVSFAFDARTFNDTYTPTYCTRQLLLKALHGLRWCYNARAMHVMIMRSSVEFRLHLIS